MFAERQCHPLRCAPRRGNGLSQCISGSPQIVLCAPSYLTAFSTGTRQCPQDSISATPHTSKTLVFKPHWLQKCKNQPHLFSQSVALGKFFPCVIPFALLSLSHTSFCDQGSLPSAAPMICFSPKPHLHISYLLLCGLLSLSSCAVCSVSPQINFLGIHNDVIFI